MHHSSLLFDRLKTNAKCGGFAWLILPEDVNAKLQLILDPFSVAVIKAEMQL